MSMSAERSVHSGRVDRDAPLCSAGPSLLPADIREGDWTKIGQLGTYGACLRTQVNGFAGLHHAFVAGPPLLVTAGYEIPELSDEVDTGELLPKDAALSPAV